ncbi:hypothetical protein TgHK011_005900 [Trichoderma gracile]|nr:hypothetical protein TgHK011_005900 [Trichoderma gracile]
MGCLLGNNAIHTWGMRSQDSKSVMMAAIASSHLTALQPAPDQRNSPAASTSGRALNTNGSQADRRQPRDLADLWGEFVLFSCSRAESEVVPLAAACLALTG